MEDFSFCNPTRIEFGKDKEKNIGKYISEYGVKNLLLVYGSERIKHNGFYHTIEKSLREFGIDFVSFGGVINNPSLSLVKESIRFGKEQEVDGVLAIGGGMVLDGSKIMAAGILYDGDVWDFFEGKTIEKSLPIFDIMVLNEEENEINGFAVITNEKTKQKIGVKSPHNYPKVSVINPELQKSNSKKYLAYITADVITHLLEAYFTAKVHPRFISRQVESIIKTVMQATEVLLENPDNREAYSDLTWATTVALSGITTVGISEYTFPNHLIEYPLTELYSIPHGAGLSVVMIAWMKWYYKQNEKQFERFAKEIFDLKTAQEGIKALENWFNQIGTPTKLKQLGLTQENIPEIIEALNFQQEFKKEELEEILSGKKL